MVVEDDPEYANILQELLEINEFAAMCYTSGRASMKEMESGMQYDTMLLTFR